MGSALHVASEVAPLRRVCLHRPGAELLNLTPENLDRLLFDDIPYLEVARAEHDEFARILRAEGVDVVYIEQLAAEAIDATPGGRKEFTDLWLSECGVHDDDLLAAIRERLDAIEDTRAFVEQTMAGLTRRDLDLPEAAPTSLARRMGERAVFGSGIVVDPMPNLYFTRDTFMVVGNGVNLNRMLTPTRQRETVYGSYVFSHHPVYQGVPLWYRRDAGFHAEGGDVLNLTPNTICVGISQRTEPSAVDLMARTMLWGDEECPIDVIYAANIPSERAFMHLDTVLTQLDEGRFLVHPGIMGTIQVFRITRGHRDGELHIEELVDRLDHVLASALGLDAVELVQCGGDDPVAAAREQWSDGSNTLALSPGRVCVYQRNSVTNELLSNLGVELVEIPSAELSRGRGGPHCMSMPFWRGDEPVS